MTCGYATSSAFTSEKLGGGIKDKEKKAERVAGGRKGMDSRQVEIGKRCEVLLLLTAIAQ